jgi:hypothetical protein
MKQVRAGSDVKTLSGRALRFQQEGAVRQLLQGDGGVLDGDDLRPARRRGFVAGDIDVPIVIDGDGIARVIAAALPMVALQPDLIAIRALLNCHNVVAGVRAGRVASDVGVVA